MCGKTNPAGSETCQYCQARLTPLDSKPGSDAADANSVRPDSQTPSGGDEADWLRDLLGSEGTPEPASEGDGQSDQGDGGEEGDWLDRIRQRTQEDEDAVSKIGPKPNPDNALSQADEPASDASELEEWLKSLEEADGEAQPAASTPSSPTSEVPPPAEPAQNLSEEDDDWLRSLTARIDASQSMEDHMQTFRSSQGDAPEEPPAEPVDTGELPEWLQNFSAGDSNEDVPTQPGGEGTPAEGQAGWLASFGQAGEDASDLSADELPDWAKNVQDQAGEPAEPAPEAASADEIPDWLQELQDEPPAEEASPEPVASPEQPPDWQTAAEQPQAAAEEASAEELPDWLQDLKNDQPGAEAPTPDQPEPPVPAEEIPDWMKNAPPVEEAPSQPAPEESVPDWMADAALPESEEQQPAAEEDEIPQWMSDYEPSTGEEPVGTPAEAEQEMPDWLKDSGEPPAEVGQVPEEPAAAEVPEAEMPDWLQEIGQPPAEGDQVPEEPVAADQPSSETPEWLKDFSTLPDVEAEPASAESVSNWLDDIEEPEAPAAQTGPAAQDEAAPAEEIPDWLKAIKDGSQPEEEPGAPLESQGMPDWMSNPQEIESKWEEPSQPEGAPAESVSPFSSSEMDALLADVAPSENAEQPAVPEGDAESIEPAQLPNWLQAMRPVESAVTDIPEAAAAEEQRVEKSGPLAGLRGVLPVEDLAGNYRKPPVYINKLQVSEKQHLHSSLLESIVADEAQVQPVPVEATHASQTIIRLLVAAFLIFLVFVPALTGFTLEVPADLSASQPGVAQAFQSITELAPGSNILLAADFEAGLTGEITTAALPVLKYLQTRQPKLFVASTVPVGPVLGEMLLSQASITPVANFNYIAGGTHALKMIGAHATLEQPAPLQQVIPYPYGQGWADPGLQGIKDITDFQRILVLTDSLENARAWVEQVQPGLGSQTQILIISSAQVAPLVRTYAESGQVNGVVSGLMGGAAFEQLSQQSGPGSASWTAYQLTMGAVILLIIAGALSTGVSMLLQPEKSKRKV